VEHRNRLLFHSSAWSHDGSLERTLATEEDHDNANLQRPLSISDLPPGDVRRFYRQCQSATSPFELMNDFLELACTRAPQSRAIVLKSADQMAFVDAIREWRPDARIVAITRDGRDAAISAQEYKKLMEDKPWFGGHKPFQQLLRDWVQKAKQISHHHKEGKLYLLRYEDLTHDFSGTMGDLFDWLELPTDAETILEIEATTDFERATGRARGSDGVGVIRKGAVGEWQAALTPREKKAAWKLAKSRLHAFGYTESGELRTLPNGGMRKN